RPRTTRPGGSTATTCRCAARFVGMIKPWPSITSAAWHGWGARRKSVPTSAAPGRSATVSATWSRMKPSCRTRTGSGRSGSCRMALEQLPRIVDEFGPIGPLSDTVALEAGLAPGHRPLVFATPDDQQAGLIGGGAVDAGQVAIVLGTSAVVNASSDKLPGADDL